MHRLFIPILNPDVSANPAGEMVNQSFVHLINTCGKLTVRTVGRHFFKPGNVMRNPWTTSSELQKVYH